MFSFHVGCLVRRAIVSAIVSERFPLLKTIFPNQTRLASLSGSRPLGTGRVTLTHTHTQDVCPVKERKKTDNPREGWEDGTPPPHRDFKERGVMR